MLSSKPCLKETKVIIGQLKVPNSHLHGLGGGGRETCFNDPQVPSGGLHVKMNTPETWGGQVGAFKNKQPLGKKIEKIK